MPSKYIRLKIVLPGSTSCRRYIEIYLCVQRADDLKERSKQSLTCVLFWTWKQRLLFPLFANLPPQNTQDSFRPWSLSTQWAQNRPWGGSECAQALPGRGLPAALHPSRPVQMSPALSGLGLSLHLLAPFLWIMALATSCSCTEVRSERRQKVSCLSP